jgi:hypothetical protein
VNLEVERHESGETRIGVSLIRVCARNSIISNRVELCRMLLDAKQSEILEFYHTAMRTESEDNCRQRDLVSCYC